MAHHKSLKKKGKPVAEWNLKPAELKALIAAAPQPKTKPKIPKLDVPKDKLFVPPKVKLHHHLLDLGEFHSLLTLTKVRKNQKDLTDAEWISLKAAISALAESTAASPRYDEFVDVHHRAMTTGAGMAWGAHRGINFLSWHREFLAKFEARLQLVNPTVTLPYWDWANDRGIPAALADLTAFPSWPITRRANAPGPLPTQAQVNGVLASGVTPPSYDTFRAALESPPHDQVHIAIGGDMATSRSPRDPIFWLHHAMVDKLWADWQRANVGAAFDPPNLGDVLRPTPIFTRRVGEILKTTDLGYVYG